MSSGRLLLGVSASVAGSLGHSLGMTLQKRAHMRLEAEGGSDSGRASSRKTWKDAEWQFGLALYLISSTLPPTIALSMLPVFVAAPLAAVGLVANAVFAKYILSSSFARTDALGTLLVSVGSCSVAVFGAIDEPPLSLDDLLLLYKRHAYVVYFIVYAFVVSALVFSELYWRRKISSLRSRCLDSSSTARFGMNVAGTVSSRVALNFVTAVTSTAPATDLIATSEAALSEEEQPLLGNRSSPCSDASSSYASTAVSPAIGSNDAVDEMYRQHFAQANEDLLLLSPDEPKTTRAEQVAKYVSGFLSAVISGLICSQTLLLAKSGIGLIVLKFRGHSQFGDPLALAIVAGLITTALSNLYYIQRALRLCSTLTVVPLCYCSSSLSALVSSLVYFDQMRLLSSLQIAMISAGIVLLASGVALLSSKADGQDRPQRIMSD
ncbi:hypothetical protein GGI15_000502 [Coemansia interrupta]|uniref:Magnesium transporter n=1 Tax=Coemansia interrupta TaxID=1126814 RepID=A0A9W8HLV0_9FUNG|nr:hypothetical protein GGI15_000502 [Coemansia interrupta]